MTQPPLISIERVTKRFPSVVALDDVSLQIVRGECHAIVGENGAGKSTLMKILSGVITQYEGGIRLRGQPVRFTSTRDAERAGVNMIHQELTLVEQLTAAANVFLGRETRLPLGLLDDRSMERAAGDLLAQLECHVPPSARTGDLRVGDQQLVEIAKALSLDSDILIMDEPTSALAEAEVERLYRVVARLRQQGVTILYISHKLDEIFRLSDRVSVLRDGQLVTTRQTADTNPKEVTHLMVGREMGTVDLGSSRKPGRVVLDVTDLALPWPGHARQWRLKGINFSVHRGETVGLAGLMGAGRTELLECLFGASEQRPTGLIELEGEPVDFRHPSDAKRAGIALVTEDRKRLGLFSLLSVGENITMCTLPRAVRAGWISRSREQDMAGRIADRLAVKTSGLDAPVTSLSGGNQQKTIIGRWLLTNPRVLLLDDPTRGVDVGAKAELYRLMDELCRAGIAIILTSSELPELLTVCDRILVLSEGRLTAEFSREEATEQKIMEAATVQSAKYEGRRTKDEIRGR
jgi:ribose transport system ATP-binding protein